MAAPHVLVLDRAVDVLEHLAQVTEPATISTIARETGVPKATAHRIISTLEARGYVMRDPSTERYLLGTRCLYLGTRSADQFDLRRIAQPTMQAIRDDTLESVHLAVYSEGYAVYVEKLETPLPVATRSRVGDRAPVHAVAPGLVLLAHQTVEEIDRVVGRPLEQRTPRTITDPEALRRRLASARARGYAEQRSENFDGVCGVSVPIHDHTGAVVAAVGCCVPESRFGRSRVNLMRERLAAGASMISAAMGHEGMDPGVSAISQ